jgi:hypothetical protein
VEERQSSICLLNLPLVGLSLGWVANSQQLASDDSTDGITGAVPHRSALGSLKERRQLATVIHEAVTINI